MSLKKRIQLASAGMTVLALVSCGDKPTAFSSPEAYHSFFLLQGTALDKTKQIAQAVESGEAKGIKIDSGMSREQELKADAEMHAVHARASEDAEHKGSDSTVGSTEFSGSSLPTPSFIESVKAAAASAASAREAAEAAKVRAETEVKAASEAAAKATLDAAAKTSALALAQESLKQVMENNPSPDDAALKAAQEVVEAASKAASDATAKASAGATVKATAEEAAKKATEDAAKAASEAEAKVKIEAAAKAAAAKAAEQEAEETKAKMSAKTAEQKAQEDEDKKDFEDDGDFEVSMPPQVIGNDPNIFKEACSTAMKVDSKKLVFAKDKAIKVSKDQVLVVYVTSGSMNVKFDGDKIRGLCLYVANGSKVNIPLGKSKINGLFYYQRGSKNTTQTTFSHGGKFHKGVVLFSGENNSASFSGGGEPRCKQLKVLGSSGNLTCKK